jgi:hypothetical protein
LAAVVDESAEWSESDYLLARISDALELSNWLFIQANSEDNDIPAPAPIPRPGHVEPEPESDTYTHASTNEVIDFFNRMSNL